MNPATPTSPSRQETIQPETTTPDRRPESDVRPIGKPSDSKLRASSSSSAPKSEIGLNQPPDNHAPDEEQIRRRAYELYVEGGYCDGNHEEDWLAAERELSGKDK